MTEVTWEGGKGKVIDRVQVSINGGISWVDANIQEPPKKIREAGDNSNQQRSWVQFEAAVALHDKTLSKESREMPKFVCHTFDSNGNTQLAKWWYPKGYLYNGWHKL